MGIPLQVLAVVFHVEIQIFLSGKLLKPKGIPEPNQLSVTQ
jgi:hypothetical protein